MRISDWSSDVCSSDLHFAAKLDQKYYERMTAERMFRNRFFMTVVIRPTANATDKLMDFLRKKQEDKNANIEEALELLEDKVRDLEKLLLRVSPRRVGIYDHRGRLSSEPPEIRNQDIPGPHR